MDLSFLPHVNATLNGIATVLLFTGFVLIKKRHITAHRNCMLAATAVSAVFLVGYVTHDIWRWAAMGGSHTLYHGQGWLKGFYYAMLLTHIVLAMTIPVFAVFLIRLGLTKRYEQHRRLAKVGFPIWMYVSITGVMIYLMLFWFNPVK